MSTHAGLVIGVLAASAALWWLIAPGIVSVSDARLKGRNPDHHRKLVRFYRTFGVMAILIGVAVSIITR